MATTDCYGTAMRKASRRLTQLYDDALAPTGLRSTQFAILAELAERAAQPPTVAELAAALVTDRSSLGHTLKPLERDGLLAIRPGDDDRRRRHVVLTKRGLATLVRAVPLWEQAQARFAEVFGAKSGAVLRDTLLAIANDERLTL